MARPGRLALVGLHCPVCVLQPGSACRLVSRCRRWLQPSNKQRIARRCHLLQSSCQQSVRMNGLSRVQVSTTSAHVSLFVYRGQGVLCCKPHAVVSTLLSRVTQGRHALSTPLLLSSTTRQPCALETNHSRYASTSSV